ncbi:hypothetical protein JCM11251_001571 [Rhodosporidiobolus azoricus]
MATKIATQGPSTSSPYIVCSDWDGTITTRDSNDCATDELGFGSDRRRELNLEILNKVSTFRDAFAEMLKSVSDNGHSFEDVKQYLVKHIGLDPGFKECFSWLEDAEIPLVVVSSGMKPIIQACLANLVGPEDAAKIDILANDVELVNDKEWRIVYRHPESGFGHDKSRSTALYKQLAHNPTIFFCADGVSDMSAAKACDMLFVKIIPGHTNDLSVFCDRENIPYVDFTDFRKVKTIIASIVGGEKTIKQALEEAKAERDASKQA